MDLFMHTYVVSEIRPRSLAMITVKRNDTTNLCAITVCVSSCVASAYRTYNTLWCFFIDETVPHFPPTYRYKRGTRETYEHIKVKRAGVGLCY